VKNAAFRKRLVGATHEVVVLEHRDRTRGDLVGLTGNYVEVGFEGAERLKRTMTRVRITAANADGVRGEWAA
jgi:tRNA A37 methylthiotransferase MiaB